MERRISQLVDAWIGRIMFSLPAEQPTNQYYFARIICSNVVSRQLRLCTWRITTRLVNWVFLPTRQRTAVWSSTFAVVLSSVLPNYFQEAIRYKNGLMWMDWYVRIWYKENPKVTICSETTDKFSAISQPWRKMRYTDAKCCNKSLFWKIVLFRLRTKMLRRQYFRFYAEVFVHALSYDFR